MSEANAPKTYGGYQIEGRVFAFIGVFFGVVAGIYWFTSYEDAGGTMLIMALFLGFLPAAYMLWWSRHMKPRPEDRDEADHADGAGAVGAFPSSSIWPFVMGIGAAFVALAFVFGAWLSVLGGAAMCATLIGYVVESRRGGYV